MIQAELDAPARPPAGVPPPSARRNPPMVYRDSTGRDDAGPVILPYHNNLVCDRSRHGIDGACQRSASRASARNRRLYPGRPKHTATANIDYGADDVDFLRACDAYRRSTSRFPTTVEYLRIAESLGWARTRTGRGVAAAAAAC